MYICIYIYIYIAGKPSRTDSSAAAPWESPVDQDALRYQCCVMSADQGYWQSERGQSKIYVFDIK